MELWARDWDEIFDWRPGYYTQEFWYLLIGSMIAEWSGRPMTVSAACQAMKSGSNRTREQRIKRAVDDGLLIKTRAGEDGRSVFVRPTPLLEAKILDYCQRSLASIPEMLREE